MTDLRWAVMGTGRIAVGVAPHIQAADGCTVTMVASRDRGKAASLATDLGLDARAACTYDELEAADVDAVYITLPNSMHVAWSVRLLDAGKHVICEKPLTPFLAEAERVFDAAERAGKVYADGYMNLHHPQTDLLRSLGTDPGSPIGPLRVIRAHRCSDLAERPGLFDRRSHALQGGALMDLGVYPLGLALFILGERPETIAAACRLAAAPGETGRVDATTAAGLTFPSGVLLETTSSIEIDQDASVSLHGDLGSAYNDWAYKPDPHRAVTRIVRNERHPRGEGEEELVVEDGGDRFVNQFADFARAVRGEAPVRPTREWSLLLTETIERIHAAVGVRF